MRMDKLVELVMRHYNANQLKSAKSVQARLKNLSRVFSNVVPESVHEVEDYKAARFEEGAAPATVANELAVLSKGLKLAEERGLVTNPPPVKMPRVDNARLVYVSRTELRRILAAYDVVDPIVADVVRWLCYAGWRRGEALGLKWDNVYEDRTVVQLPTTKNRQPRVAHLGKKLKEILDRRWEQREGDLVFHRKGRPIRRFDVRWKSTLRKLNMNDDIRPHDLRRSFAIFATEAEIPRTIQMSCAGWKTETMHRRYGIVPSEQQRAAFDSVADYIDGKSKDLLG